VRERYTRLGASLLLAPLLALQACGGRSGSVTPAASMDMRLTPKSVSPASVAAPPMARTQPQPASAMALRRPRSDVQPPSWTQLPGGATFVAASPDGTIWVLSTQGPGNGDKFIYHYANGTWTNVPGAAARLAVAPDGTLWAVNTAGGIYAYGGGGYWSTLAGGATDISIGPDSSVYVISNQGGGPYGRGIWHYSGGAWTQMPGVGVRVVASSDTGTYPGGITPGGFYVLNAGGSIYYYSPGSGYTQVVGAATELAPTKSGGLFALGYPPSGGSSTVYYNNLATGVWSAEPGAGVSIATDGAHVYAIGAAGGIYSSPVGPPHSSSLLTVQWYGNGSFAAAPGTTTSVAPASSGAYNPVSGGTIAFAQIGQSATIKGSQTNAASAPYAGLGYFGSNPNACSGKVSLVQNDATTWTLTATASAFTDCALLVTGHGDGSAYPAAPEVYFMVTGPVSLGGNAS
jgi:virginiamycin B lyase